MIEVKFIKDCQYSLDGINQQSFKKGQVVKVDLNTANCLIRSNFASKNVELKMADSAPKNKMMNSSEKSNKGRKKGNK